MHGEVGNLVVALAMEKGSDSNKMRYAWEGYCMRIGECDEGFKQGHVNKQKKKKKDGKEAKKRPHY